MRWSRFFFGAVLELLAQVLPKIPTSMLYKSFLEIHSFSLHLIMIIIWIWRSANEISFPAISLKKGMANWMSVWIYFQSPALLIFPCHSGLLTLQDIKCHWNLQKHNCPAFTILGFICRGPANECLCLWNSCSEMKESCLHLHWTWPQASIGSCY